MKGNSTSQVVFIRSDTIGRDDDELGANLMMAFIYHLSMAETTPDYVLLLNAGVKLVAEGSDVIDDLKQLESRGTEILACGTCLNFFKIKEKQRVGKASNMPEITKTLLEAAKVVTI
jgi:selenium metabolism protein YedF